MAIVPVILSGGRNTAAAVAHAALALSASHGPDTVLVVMAAAERCIDQSPAHDSAGVQLQESHADSFLQLPDISVDYALMEHSEKVTMVPASFDWSGLSNPRLVDLLITEVQSGEYLGEDDLVRLDDQYGRAS